MNTGSLLLELQEIDLEILRNKKALSEIPEAQEIQEVRSKLKELAKKSNLILGTLKDQRLESEDNQGRRRTLTRHVEEIQLDNSTTDDFRRVQTNNAELDRLAKRLEKVDFNQHHIDEELTRLESLYAQANQIKISLETREVQLMEAFKDRALNLKTKLDDLNNRKEQILDVLDEDLVRDYERSCEQHSQVGVGHLINRSCSGCRVEFQQSQIDALRRGPAITECPVCGRILIVREYDE